MAIAVFFQHEGLTTEKYSAAIAKLEAAGAGAPKGRTYHSAFGPPDALMVFDIWDSPEDLDAFAPTLMPILTELGIGLTDPDIMPVQNTIVG